MMLSTWDSKKPQRLNSSLSSAHIILEFERTKKQRIFSHKLGKISFEAKDINGPRDEVIAALPDKYKKVVHTYIPKLISEEDVNGEFSVYAHGHPMGNGNESCSRSGLVCAAGQGTDASCSPGKCIVGKLSFANDKKWRYESLSTYDSDLPLVYFMSGDKELRLRTVLRGKVDSFSDNGPVTLSINSPASVTTRIFPPPKYYLSRDFGDTPVVLRDNRLNFVNHKPKDDVTGIADRKKRFLAEVVLAIYPGYTQSELSLVMKEAGVREQLKQEMIDRFADIPSPWFGRVSEVIEQEYDFGKDGAYTNYEFISVVYDILKEEFNKLIQVSPSSISASVLEYGKDLISRPVYSRLPGISEAYRSDPLFSENETPAQWLMSGTDDFLSSKKDQLSDFYRTYLDPETCSPLVLDWLAQHVGLTGPLWDSRWEKKIKICMIENAFGWYDRAKSVSLPGGLEVKTRKGEALDKFPFSTSDVWTASPEEDNSLRVRSDEIGGGARNGATEILHSFSYKESLFDEPTYTLALSPTNSVKIYDGKWDGLMESKGSLLSFAFLSSVFNLKSHISSELEVGAEINNLLVLKPKSGLRAAEILAPPLWPYKAEVLQVGGEVTDADGNVLSGNDLKINNYANQIVAGISRVTTVEDSKNMFFRVPYYYNRDGKSWDRVTYISDNWMPNNLNKRVQYAFLSADLWAVGDAFFEPEIQPN